MPKYSIDNTTLTNIANPLRELRGLTDGMTPEEMAINANAVQTNVTNALAKIAEKGVVVPDGANSDDLEKLIDAIETGSGGGTPETCTVTVIVESGPLLPGQASFEPIVVYTDGSGSLIQAVGGGTYHVVQGSIMFVGISNAMSCSGNCVKAGTFQPNAITEDTVGVLLINGTSEITTS